jgi:hypothetical protein
MGLMEVGTMTMVGVVLAMGTMIEVGKIVREVLLERNKAQLQ